MWVMGVIRISTTHHTIRRQHKHTNEIYENPGISAAVLQHTSFSLPLVLVRCNRIYQANTFFHFATHPQLVPQLMNFNSILFSWGENSSSLRFLIDRQSILILFSKLYNTVCDLILCFQFRINHFLAACQHMKLYQ